jgi:hypothetical protein
MQQNQLVASDLESPVDLTDIEEMLNDEHMSDEAKDMLRTAVKASNWKLVRRLLSAELKLPED